MNKKAFVALALVALVVAMPLSASTAEARSLRDIDQKVREAHSKAVQKYQQVKKEYQDLLGNYKDAAQRYRTLKSTEASERYFEATQAYLAKAVEYQVTQIERGIALAESSGELSAEDLEGLKESAGEEIEDLQEIKSRIEGAATLDELRDIIEDLKPELREANSLLKYVYAVVFGAKLQYALDKVEAVSAMVGDKIIDLKNNGADTQKLEEWHQDLNQKIAMARQDLAKAQDMYMGIGHFEEFDALAKQVDRYMKNANSYLKQAYGDLKRIVLGMLHGPDSVDEAGNMKVIKAPVESVTENSGSAGSVKAVRKQ